MGVPLWQNTASQCLPNTMIYCKRMESSFFQLLLLFCVCSSLTDICAAVWVDLCSLSFSAVHNNVTYCARGGTQNNATQLPFQPQQQARHGRLLETCNWLHLATLGVKGKKGGWGVEGGECRVRQRRARNIKMRYVHSPQLSRSLRCLAMAPVSFPPMCVPLYGRLSSAVMRVEGEDAPGSANHRCTPHSRRRRMMELFSLHTLPTTDNATAWRAWLICAGRGRCCCGSGDCKYFNGTVESYRKTTTKKTPVRGRGGGG